MLLSWRTDLVCLFLSLSSRKKGGGIILGRQYRLRKFHKIFYAFLEMIDQHAY